MHCVLLEMPLSDYNISSWHFALSCNNHIHTRYIPNLAGVSTLYSVTLYDRVAFLYKK